MRWTRDLRKTNAGTRGRRSRVYLTPRRWRQVVWSDPHGDGGKQARSPGRARYKPLKPLRRECRIASAEPVCSCALFCTILHTRPRVQRASGIPCALSFREERKLVANLGRVAPRERVVISAPAIKLEAGRCWRSDLIRCSLIIIPT